MPVSHPLGVPIRNVKSWSAAAVGVVLKRLVVAHLLTPHVEHGAIDLRLEESRHHVNQPNIGMRNNMSRTHLLLDATRLAPATLRCQPNLKRSESTTDVAGVSNHNRGADDTKARMRTRCLRSRA